MIKLYHYVHCPFCIRVRMGLGLLKADYESVVLPYNDETTPLALTGVKMLPIMVDSNGVAMNESLDILRALDHNHQLDFEQLKAKREEVEDLLDRLASPIHNLCMPYWVWSPEFDSVSRDYFVAKKSKKRGPFALLAQRKDEFLAQLAPLLIEVEENLNPFFKSKTFSIVDIMIAAHLWGLYIFPEFQFSPKMHKYLQDIKSLTHFNYHEDFWRAP